MFINLSPIFRRGFFFVFILLLFVQCSNDNNPVELSITDDNQAANQIEEIIDEFCKSTGCIGLSVGIIKDGKRSYYSQGVIDLETKIKPDENTIYEIASITKSFTGFLLADLAQSVQLSLNDAANDITDLKLPEYKGYKITIKDLATHTSGLPRLPGNLTTVLEYDKWNPYENYTVDHLKDYLERTAIAEKPGSNFLYSNLGYAILGYTIEQIFKKNYEDLIKEKICEPLGMDDTRIKLNSEQLQRFATAYYSDGRNVPHWEFNVFKGAAAIRSTVEDMLSYIEGNLGIKAPELYSRFELAHTPFKNNYGLGWYNLEGEGVNKIFHDGLTYGNHSYICFDMNKKIGLVILSNHALYFNKNSKNIYSLSNDIWYIITSENTGEQQSLDYVDSYSPDSKGYKTFGDK